MSTYDLLRPSKYSLLIIRVDNSTPNASVPKVEVGEDEQGAAYER